MNANFESHSISRRSFLKAAMAASAVSALALTGCGGAASSTVTASSTASSAAASAAAEAVRPSRWASSTMWIMLP